MYAPRARSMARLRAAAGPRFSVRSSVTPGRRAAASRSASVRCSVDPSSMTTTSKSRWVWAATLASACSRWRPALKTGTMIETSGVLASLGMPFARGHAARGGGQTTPQRTQPDDAACEPEEVAEGLAALTLCQETDRVDRVARNVAPDREIASVPPYGGEPAQRAAIAEHVGRS